MLLVAISALQDLENSLASEISLVGCTVDVVSEKEFQKPHAFSLLCADDDRAAPRRYIFVAQDARDRTSWMETIAACSALKSIATASVSATASAPAAASNAQHVESSDVSGTKKSRSIVPTAKSAKQIPHDALDLNTSTPAPTYAVCASHVSNVSNECNSHQKFSFCFSR
jgi:hypothetical protein